MTTAAEKRHLERVAQLPCVVCGAHGVEVHHLRLGQGMSQRAEHWVTVPLCPECHRGPSGIHGNRALLKVQKIEEIDLLARTIEALSR